MADNYEIFETDGGIRKYKIRQIRLFRISGTDKWIMRKVGAMGDDIEKLITLTCNADPKPREFTFNLHAYDFGAPHDTDDDGVVLGDWPVIATLSVQTDKVVIVKGDDLSNYDLFSYGLIGMASVKRVIKNT